MRRVALATSRLASPLARSASVMTRLVASLLLGGLVSCGGAAPSQPPVDYATPNVDPVACPERALARLAAKIDGAQLTISLEPIVEAARIDKVPCPHGSNDDACLARARQRPVPDGYEQADVTIGGDVAHVEVTYELDRQRRTETAPSLAAMVAKLKELQAKGHHVVMISGHSVGASETRHAALTYKRVGGRQRRVGTLRWRADDTARAIGEAQAAAESTGMEVRKVEVTDDEELVMTATCGGVSAHDVSPQI